MSAVLRSLPVFAPTEVSTITGRPRRSLPSWPFVASYSSVCFRDQSDVLGSYSPFRGMSCFLPFPLVPAVHDPHPDALVDAGRSGGVLRIDAHQHAPDAAIREHRERAMEEGRPDPASTVGGRDREVVDPAAVLGRARGEHAGRYPRVPRQQPERRVVHRGAGFLLDPLIERRRMMTQVVRERLVEQGVDRREIFVRVDPADVDPLRRSTGLQRLVQVDLHVPEVMDGSQAPVAEHRGGGIVSRVDREPEPERRWRRGQLRGTFLDAVQQRGADAPPPVFRVDDAPGPCDVQFLERDLCVPDDPLGVVDRHPGIGGEIAHAAPFPPHEVFAQHNLSSVVELVGDDHVGHRTEVVRRRRSQPVSVG